MSMHGAVYATIVVAVVLLVAAVFASPWFLIPALFLGLFFLVSGPLAGAMKGTGGDRAGSGTPSTSQASYDPVSSPGERRA